MIIAWKAWYVNESHTELETYTSTDAQFEDLPRDGCLGFVLFEDTVKPPHPESGKRFHVDLTLLGQDYYFRSGEVYGANKDTRQENEERYPNAQVIRGMWTTSNLINLMQDEMRECKLEAGQCL